MRYNLALPLLATSAIAVPYGPFTSILTSPVEAESSSLPVGRTPLSRVDMVELGRLALAVNSAYCPTERKLQPHPSSGLTIQERKRKRHDYNARTQEGSSIIRSSEDGEYTGVNNQEGMKWYISHTPSTDTLTLAFSSLKSTDDLLELLASSPTNPDETLISLPSTLFPPNQLANLTGSSGSRSQPKVHHSYRSALFSQGEPALQAILELIDTPPLTMLTPADVLKSYIASFRAPEAGVSSRPIKKIDIVGHGLGSAIGLLVALSLQLELSNPSLPAPSSSPIAISATLFGLPRVGDKAFAQLIDALTQASTSSTPAHSSLRVHRVTSYADTVAHLPERHLGLSHPSRGEIWIGADPRIGYICVPEQQGRESDACSASIALERTSLLDHNGPFAGVWIQPQVCSSY
ncbi:hypothetical protein I316_07873 [Kwoniella heveanensis BCC8398]|uniref:Fungal lipase-type domain-containing protein n=1 Tax=Kwoniella heveanensis BCC8398 TaxID=1296120 RepID=A0A1B9GHT3_9TREE|nr:hypothetical protein I316_07873 [Kwoniella heveanensis BCC8398]